MKKLKDMYDKIWDYREQIEILCNPFEDFYEANSSRDLIPCGDINSRRQQILEIADNIMKYLQSADTKYYNKARFAYGELYGAEKKIELFKKSLDSIIDGLGKKIVYRKTMSNGQRIEQGEGEEV